MYHLKVGCAAASIISTDGTFLVDCHNIHEHSHLLPTDKRLRGVFITHQHHDHYSGLEYLRKKGYVIDCLIYSPYERRYGDNSVTVEEWNEFKSHREYFEGQGTKTYAPYRQGSFDKPWWDTNGVQYWIVGPAQSVATSDTRELHDGCLVIRATIGKRICCFTGDASDTNLNYVARNTNNYCNDILRASHHGSLNGADLDFIKGASAQYTVISTEPGVYDNIPHPTALKRYQDNTAKTVYRTDAFGTVVWTI
jgi:beta-lactamase superfamily II metal-dependent hydrolase